MADFYVDGTAGNDGAPGTSAQPVRTITRATELAAESPDRAGTIHVSEGTYDLSRGENFPILVRPGYVLAGSASSTPPVIRFGARARDAGGTIVSFWGSVMMVAGAGIRRVVIEADPQEAAPPCNGISAVATVEDGVVFEDVAFRSRDPDTDGFSSAIFGLGNRGTITDVRFDPGGGNLYWNGGGCSVTRSAFVGPWAFAQFGPGEHDIINNRFTDVALSIGSDTDARVSRNEFTGVRGGAAIRVDGGRLRGSSPEGPLIEDNRVRDCEYGIDCERPGTARFRGNVIEEFLTCGVFVRHGATPLFERGNVIRQAASPFARLLRTTNGAFPAFEETTFDGALQVPTAGHLGVLASIILESQADLGGGGRSRGDNSFGRVFTPAHAEIPGGGVITAHNNLWSSLFFYATPGTVVETDGARIDPARPPHAPSS
jgi:hypothetical protein